MTTTDTPTGHPPVPVPVPDEHTAEFWSYAADGVLATQRCGACGWRAYPPRMVCPSCLADPADFEWSPVSGDGHLATWTVVRTALLPGFADLVPYVVGEIELLEQDGLRVVARLDGDVEPRIGLPMRVAFVDGGYGMRVPVFAEVSR